MRAGTETALVVRERWRDHERAARSLRRSLSPPMMSVVCEFASACSPPTWRNRPGLIVGPWCARGRRTVTAARRPMGVHEASHCRLSHHGRTRARRVRLGGESTPAVAVGADLCRRGRRPHLRHRRDVGAAQGPPQHQTGAFPRAAGLEAAALDSHQRGAMARGDVGHPPLDAAVVGGARVACPRRPPGGEAPVGAAAEDGPAPGPPAAAGSAPLAAGGGDAQPRRPHGPCLRTGQSLCPLRRAGRALTGGRAYRASACRHCSRS